MSGQSGSRLDQIVKGAAPLGTSVPSITSRSPTPAIPLDNADLKAQTPVAHPNSSDPLTHLPSSPPQIYLNLLILEASLRSQYLTLRARRRQNTFFLLLLALWITSFLYALFLRPREDGSGMGGSVYWVVEMAEKVALMGGVVTAILVWGTGQWERGVRWPRRFVGTTNRGLRTINAKIVVINGPWWKEMLAHLELLFPYSILFSSHGSSHHYIDTSAEKRGHQGVRHDDDLNYIREEDLWPGGDYIKLLLFAKPFSPDFRENWELYRTEYWEKENERRATLLRRLRKYERQLAKEEGGWLWWTGWRGWRRAKGLGRRDGDIEKSHQRHYSEKDVKQRSSLKRTESHSRNSSRSTTTPTFDTDDQPSSRRLRRGSSSGSQSDSRRRLKVASALGSQHISRLTPTESHVETAGSTASQSPLTRGPSNISMSSGNESDI